MQTQKSLEMVSKGQFESLTISQVSRMTGMNAKAIRYYESIGLLPRPARLANSYRCYSMVDVNRLILLSRIRSLGVPLAQARQLLTRISDARCIDVQEELARLVDARLQAIDQEIAELHQLRDEITSYQHKLADCHPNEKVSFRTCVNMSCIALAEEIHDGKVNTHDCL